MKKFGNRLAWVRGLMVLGFALTTLGAMAQFSKKEQAPPAPVPVPVPNIPIQVDERLFSLQRTLVIPMRKTIGTGKCKGTVGPVWVTNEGLVVEGSLENPQGCSFKSLVLHVARSNYPLIGVNGAFEKSGRSGNYLFRQTPGLLFFGMGSALDATSFSSPWGVWENGCDISTSCYSDSAIVDAAKSEAMAQQERAASDRKQQEAEALRQRAEACVNALVPNPNPLPNETTQFYGECETGKGKSGLTMWLQSGVPFQVGCLRDGKYQDVEQCTAYFPLLPAYCKTSNYQGQCKNGEPEGVGFMLSGDRGDQQSWNGQFRQGAGHGYVSYVHNTRTCGFFGDCDGGVNQYSAWYVSGKEALRCEGGPQGCQKAWAAEPIYKNARVAADALRCDEALALDRKAQAMDAQVHNQSDKDNGARVNYADCNREAQFARARNAKDPQAIYLAASRYESDGERGRAKTLYRLIVDKFETSPIALKAADRLTRLADVEAVETSNSNATYQVQRSHEETRQSNYQQCINEYSACQSRCDNLGTSSSRSSCRSGCTSCIR